MLATIIDSIIIVLLIGSITYGYLVSRKVRLLVSTLKDLEPLVEEFSSAVDKSAYSVVKMRENIQVVEETPPQPAAAPEQPAEPATPFSSRRVVNAKPELPGMRVVRDKQDLVRAFFETSGTAKV